MGDGCGGLLLSCPPDAPAREPRIAGPAVGLDLPPQRRMVDPPIRIGIPLRRALRPLRRAQRLLPHDLARLHRSLLHLPDSHPSGERLLHCPHDYVGPRSERIDERHHPSTRRDPRSTNPCRTAARHACRQPHDVQPVAQRDGLGRSAWCRCARGHPRSSHCWRFRGRYPPSSTRALFEHLPTAWCGGGQRRASELCFCARRLPHSSAPRGFCDSPAAGCGFRIVASSHSCPPDCCARNAHALPSAHDEQNPCDGRVSAPGIHLVLRPVAHVHPRSALHRDDLHVDDDPPSGRTAPPGHRLPERAHDAKASRDRGRGTLVLVNHKGTGART